MTIMLKCGETEWPVTAIVFDKDGTLLEFGAMWGQWSRLLIARLERIAPAVEWGAALGATVVEETERQIVYDPDGPLAMASNEQIGAILAWHLYRTGRPWSEAVRLVNEAMGETNLELERTRPVREMPGLTGFLARCKAAGVEMAVATSDDTAMAERHLDWLGIRGYFQAVVGRDLVSRGKPFPDMALYACGQIGVRPSDAVMIGDTLADMEMAVEASMRAAIRIGNTGNQPEAAYEVIASYDELAVTAPLDCGKDDIS